MHLKTPWLEIFLLTFIVALGILIHMALKWFFERERWFRTKTFMARFFLSPVLFMWMLHANLEHPENQALIKLVF